MSARRRPARRWWAWEIAAGALALALPALLPLQAPLVGEIAALPLAFGLPGFAIVFSALNAGALAVRIRAENAALKDALSLMA